jgi:hypothetical protein
MGWPSQWTKAEPSASSASATAWWRSRLHARLLSFFPDPAIHEKFKPQGIQMTAAAPTKGTRLYKVTTPTSVHLVESPSKAGAVAHVARHQITAEIPPQFEVFHLAKSGVEIERVGDGPLSDDTRVQVCQSVVDVPMPSCQESGAA